MLHLEIFYFCELQQPTKNSSPKAVMVFIHGGAFNAGSGSSDLYSADYLMNYDVILVTLNYRVHALGDNAKSYLTE